MARVRIAKAEEVPEGGMIMKEHDGVQILVAKVDGKIYAMNDVCTHEGGPLHEGDLGREGRLVITCPWHDAHFDLRTGKVHQDTDWATDTACYEAGIEDGHVWVEL
jgi:nitrite reductase/ring-hydroxylating ferredoxin subunit